MIDAKGFIVGNVRDVIFNLEAKEIALKIATTTGTEISIPWNDIRIAGDVILLNKQVELPSPPVAPSKPIEVAKEPTEEKICTRCGYKNKSYAKFCIKCGSSLP